MAMAEKPDLHSKARIHRIQTKPLSTVNIHQYKNSIVFGQEKPVFYSKTRIHRIQTKPLLTVNIHQYKNSIVFCQ